MLTKSNAHASSAAARRTRSCKSVKLRAAPSQLLLRPSGSRVTRSAARQARASLAAAGRARPAPAPACEGSLGGKLRYVCQLFFPPRVSPRTAVKDRLSCVLTLDRASLLPEESMSIEERVRDVMQQYVELHEGFDGADYHSPTLETRVDAATGCNVFSLSYRVRVKRTRVGVDAGLREPHEAAQWESALGV